MLDTEQTETYDLCHNKHTKMFCKRPLSSGRWDWSPMFLKQA